MNSCNYQKSDNTKSRKEQGKIDSLEVKDSVQVKSDRNLSTTVIPIFDSSNTYLPDNRQLKRKREKILNQFLASNSPASSDYDTLVDLNYDGYRDYIIGYYGLAGTGFKYRIMAYVYSKKSNAYVFNKDISELTNPSFFINEGKITGFYIGLGGGHGKKLQWINKKWILTKEFSVSNEGDRTMWVIYYPNTQRQEKIVHSFQVIPPEEILETNRDF